MELLSCRRGAAVPHRAQGSVFPSYVVVTPNLTDFQNILRLNPLIFQSALDPARFRKVDTLQIDGPDFPTDPIPFQGKKVNNEATTGDIVGWSTEIDVSFLVGTDFSFFGLLEAGIKVGGTFQWTYENTAEHTTGQNQEMEVILRTSTVGHHEVVDVYEDTAFGSFTFVSRTGPLSAS
jgi:hypothetical protein